MRGGRRRDAFDLYDGEHNAETKVRETGLFHVGPISTDLILSYSLGLPRLFQRGRSAF